MPVAAPVTMMVRLVSRSCGVMAISWVMGHGCRGGRVCRATDREFNPGEPGYVKPGTRRNAAGTLAVNRRTSRWLVAQGEEHWRQRENWRGLGPEPNLIIQALKVWSGCPKL